MDGKTKISIVLGETGVGKSSFINAITRTNSCQISSMYKTAFCCGWQAISANHNGENYIFIDTPGLNDPRGDRQNLAQIKSVIEKYESKIRCILILFKYQDNRLTRSTLEMLQNIMECFPSPNFWNHVLIIRTHSQKNSHDFKYNRNNIENAFIEALKDSDLKNYMIKRNIKLPERIHEFYVDCRNDNEWDNREEFERIYSSIQSFSYIN